MISEFFCRLCYSQCLIWRRHIFSNPRCAYLQWNVSWRTCMLHCVCWYNYRHGRVVQKTCAVTWHSSWSNVNVRIFTLLCLYTHKNFLILKSKNHKPYMWVLEVQQCLVKFQCYTMFGALKHGRVVWEHMCGSWEEFMYFSRTWGFFACWQKDGINTGRDREYSGSIEKQAPLALAMQALLSALQKVQLKIL